MQLETGKFVVIKSKRSQTNKIPNFHRYWACTIVHNIALTFLMFVTLNMIVMCRNL